MIDPLELTAGDREARAEVCREFADQLERAAEVFERVKMSGWAARIRRDAELLRYRANHEEELIEPVEVAA